MELNDSIMQNSFFLSILFSLIKMTIPNFVETFNFLPPASILEPTIIPSFDNFYPPPILVKHHVWWYDDADIFIRISGILYGLHRQYFDNSILFQEILQYGQTDYIGMIPSRPIPFDILKHKISTTSSLFYILEQFPSII